MERPDMGHGKRPRNEVSIYQHVYTGLKSKQELVSRKEGGLFFTLRKTMQQ